MSPRHVALIGRARSGKDTAAARLTGEHLYTRVAFADPLKDLALSVDPIVSAEPGHFGYLPTRLSAVVKREGWERAKSRPEVRRTLQHLGQAIRDVDPFFWVSIALSKLDVASRWNLPVVVTDCRYRNEADELRARGFLIVRIVRPDLSEQPGSEHVSETELDDYPEDAVIHNSSTLQDLWAQLDALI
ncbi:hypothetical protein ABT095_15815 [Kitasatospora sp. NPDC002227]|uniref:deoxynucleotide monophosphate kinase family protein n=1 Tax=Kitasatospora sp. NPDC002227 TaxID=3154773 RepID=UPI0033208294